MKERRAEHRKRIDIVKIKSVQMVKEGSILYPIRKILSPKDCEKLVREYLDNIDREAFIVIALDTKNQPMAIQTVSIGTLNSSLVHPREVFKMAILSNAASIILSHNHPSGNSSPSNEDIAITKRLSECGDIFGIKVLDHIIIGDNKYTSFKEENITF
jgi:DNA repair protein RadC